MADIDIRTAFDDGDTVNSLKQLTGHLLELRSTIGRLESQVIDPFSRAQAARTIADLRSVESRIVGIIGGFERLASSARTAGAAIQGIDGSARSTTSGIQNIINAATGVSAPLRNIEGKILDINGQVQLVDRTILSAAGSARTLATSLSAAAAGDDWRRQQRILQDISGEKKRQFDAETNRLEILGKAQRQQDKETLTQVKAIQREREKAAREAFDFSQRFAPSSAANSRMVELKHQYDAETNLMERNAKKRKEEDRKAAEYAAQVWRSATGPIPSATSARFLTPQEILNAPNEQSMRAFEGQRVASQAMRGGGTGGFLGRLNRQGALEGQAAVVNTVQALASGMSPLHVAIMESTQLAGAAVQGGLISLKQIFTAMVSPVGALVGAFAGLAATIGLVGARAIEAREHADGVRGSLLLTGNAANVSEKDIAKWEASLRNLGASRSEAQQLVSAFAPLYNLVGENAKAFSEFAQIQAQITGNDLDSEIKKWTAAIAQGIPGLVNLAKAYDVGSEEQRRFIADLGERGEIQRAVSSLAELTNQVQMQGRILSAGQQSWRDYFYTIATAGLPAPFSLVALATQSLIRERLPQPSPEGPRRVSDIDTRLAPPREKIDLRSINEIVTERLRIEQEITNLVGQRTNMLAHQAAAMSAEVRERLGFGVRETERKLSETHTPEERDRFAVLRAEIEKQITVEEQAAEKDQSRRIRVAELRKQLAEATAAYEQGALYKVEGAVHKTTAAEIQAFQQVADERRRIAREALDTRLFAIDYRAAQATTDPRVQLLAIDQKIAEVRKDQTGREQELRGLETQRLAILQQIRGYIQDATLAALNQREVIAQSKEDLAGIVALRRQEAAIIAANPDSTPAQKIQARTAVIQSQINAQQRFNQLQLQGVDAQNTAASARAQTLSALTNLQVTQYSTTREAAIQSEQALTDRVTTEQAARLQNLLSLENLTVEQRASINSQLASLYEQDVQKQIELQSQLTLAIRAENERRTQYFRNFFQDAERGAADLLIAGLNKTQTRAQAFKQLGQNLVSSFVKNATEMGSDYLGRTLAPSLGVKVDPDKNTSISEVLAKAVGSALGLTKDEPKLDQRAIADKMKLAGDTQKAAADIFKQAAEKLVGAIGEGPYRGGRNPELDSGALPASRTNFKSAPIAAPVDAMGAAGEYGVGQKVVGNIAPPTEAELAALAMVRSREGRKTDPYGTMHYPADIANVRITNLAEVEATAVTKNSHAFGAYGFQPGTYRDMSKITGIDPQDISPAAQDTNALALLRQRGLNSSASWAASGPYPADISQLASSNDSLRAQLQSTTSVTTQVGQTNTRDIQATSDGTQATQSSVEASRELVNALREQSTRKCEGAADFGMSKDGKSNYNPYAKPIADKESSSSSDKGSNVSGNLGLLTQGLGLAASAAAIFGRQLSPTARAILGTVGLLTQLMSFSKGLGAAFGLTETATKAAGTASTLLSTANTANTLSTTLNTTATYTNSAAQTASAAGSAGSGVLGGIGSLFKMIPIIGMFFKQGGIVPSAAGGMMVGGSGGGGTMAILHPREMVLPAHISRGLQGMIHRENSFNNTSSTTLHYNANVTGYHPYGSRSSFESMLRQHGRTMQGWAEGAIRNRKFAF